MGQNRKKPKKSAGEGENCSHPPGKQFARVFALSCICLPVTETKASLVAQW